MADKLWYAEHFVIRHLNKEPIFSWRIREEGTNRTVATDLIKPDAEYIVALNNVQIRQMYSV